MTNLKKTTFLNSFLLLYSSFGLSFFDLKYGGKGISFLLKKKVVLMKKVYIYNIIYCDRLFILTEKRNIKKKILKIVTVRNNNNKNKTLRRHFAHSPLLFGSLLLHLLYLLQKLSVVLVSDPPPF